LALELFIFTLLQLPQAEEWIFYEKTPGSDVPYILFPISPTQLIPPGSNPLCLFNAQVFRLETEG
jgi:hypothetical protein